MPARQLVLCLFVGQRPRIEFTQKRGGLQTPAPHVVGEGDQGIELVVRDRNFYVASHAGLEAAQVVLQHRLCLRLRQCPRAVPRVAGDSVLGKLIGGILARVPIADGPYAHTILIARGREPLKSGDQVDTITANAPAAC